MGETLVIVSSAGGLGDVVDGPEVSVGVAETSSEKPLEPRPKRATIRNVYVLSVSKFCKETLVAGPVV